MVEKSKVNWAIRSKINMVEKSKVNWAIRSKINKVEKLKKPISSKNQKVKKKKNILKSPISLKRSIPKTQRGWKTLGQKG